MLWTGVFLESCNYRAVTWRMSQEGDTWRTETIWVTPGDFRPFAMTPGRLRPIDSRLRWHLSDWDLLKWHLSDWDLLRWHLSDWDLLRWHLSDWDTLRWHLEGDICGTEPHWGDTCGTETQWGDTWKTKNCWDGTWRTETHTWRTGVHWDDTWRTGIHWDNTWRTGVHWDDTRKSESPWGEWHLVNYKTYSCDTWKTWDARSLHTETWDPLNWLGTYLEKQYSLIRADVCLGNLELLPCAEGGLQKVKLWPQS